MLLGTWLQVILLVSSQAASPEIRANQDKVKSWLEAYASSDTPLLCVDLGDELARNTVWFKPCMCVIRSAGEQVQDQVYGARRR